MKHMHIDSMAIAVKNRDFSRTWSKVLIFVSFGKAFVAGAGLGLAALGIVDLAGTLGVKPLFDFIERERILDIFAIGGGALVTVSQIAWKIISR